jgi:glutaredoxin 3
LRERDVVHSFEPVVEIYTLRGCPFCVRAKALLKQKGVDFKEIDVTSNWDERVRVSDLTGHRTFPQIFVGDTFIGGCDELYDLERAGRLDSVLT